MKYMIFFTGLASTPWSVGLYCITTSEVISEIGINEPTDRECRAKFQKYRSLLQKKYECLDLQDPYFSC